MIPQTLTAILLTLPLIIMIIPSIRYWSEFKKENKKENMERKAEYKKIFFYLFISGVLCMWISWIGGIIFLFINNFYDAFGVLIFSSHYEIALYIIGLIIFYIGATTYNLNIIIAGKNLRPAPSGIHNDHRLMKEGPFAIIRHPLYVSYILILTGLCLILFIYWLLIPVACMIIGIYPTSKAEEETLLVLFGKDYIEYKQEVGMFFPKFN